MSAQTLSHTGRQERGRVARFRLDVAEWTVLRAALLSRVRAGSTPAGFEPEAFGLDPERPLTADQRARAWAGLQLRGLATHVPAEDDVTALTPSCVLGMLMLLEAEVRVDVSSWADDVVVNQAVAWSSGRTAAVARRRRQLRVADGAALLEPEPVVEVSLSAAGGLLTEVMRALPGPPAAVALEDRSPVRIGWPESAAIAQALRSGREDVAAHLSGLPASALSLLGAASAPLTGGASVSAVRRQGGGTLAFSGVWLWTDTDVVELVDASPHAVTLRRTNLGRVRHELLTALTGLLHAEEVL
ncbi:MAG TPA: hypothetical protein VKZ83_04050 [Phototrophicaceae bacterium]|nr:hypothetical protein [Phototrophicaceae bacterium]